MNTVALMALDDRVLHLPSDGAHGVALCGARMEGPWACGPLAVIDARAVSWCESCFALWH